MAIDKEYSLLIPDWRYKLNRIWPWQKDTFEKNVGTVIYGRYDIVKSNWKILQDEASDKDYFHISHSDTCMSEKLVAWLIKNGLASEGRMAGCEMDDPVKEFFDPL